MRSSAFPYLPKDFIETEEGLIFAVISYHEHLGKVGCFLRYVKTDHGWQKVDTLQANRLLQRHHPQYLYRSRQFDADFHAVNPEKIIHHYQPEVILQQRLLHPPVDALDQKLRNLLDIFRAREVEINKLGLTGSMLINQHRPDSDIDLAVYGRDTFQRTRLAVQDAVNAGLIDKLSEQLMWDNFERRACDLSFEEFSWHEARKFNKAAIEGSKFDIGMVSLSTELETDHRHYRKQGTRTLKARVLDDSQSFDFPARYRIDNALTPEVVCFTHTYVGQAVVGEVIEVRGAVECAASGTCRIVVGSTREATGEYIKVCKSS